MYSYETRTIKLVKPVVLQSPNGKFNDAYKWCVDHFGPFGSRWWYEITNVNTSTDQSADQSSLLFCFTDKDDAAFFKLTWN